LFVLISKVIDLSLYKFHHDLELSLRKLFFVILNQLHTLLSGFINLLTILKLIQIV